jgi:hypothetical protein
MDRTTSTDDIARVKSYMYSLYCGKDNRAPRHEIASKLGIEDRSFRLICSQIPEIITSSRWGYYILPLVDLTGEETRFARAIVEGEERRRMIALYLRQRRQRKAIKNMGMSEKQYEFQVA